MRATTLTPPFRNLDRKRRHFSLLRFRVRFPAFMLYHVQKYHRPIPNLNFPPLHSFERPLVLDDVSILVVWASLSPPPHSEIYIPKDESTDASPSVQTFQANLSLKRFFFVCVWRCFHSIVYLSVSPTVLHCFINYRKCLSGINWLIIILRPRPHSPVPTSTN